jgi:hypothetical protein
MKEKPSHALVASVVSGNSFEPHLNLIVSAKLYVQIGSHSEIPDKHGWRN